MVVGEEGGDGKGSVKGFRKQLKDRKRVKCARDWAKTDKLSNSRTAILQFDLKYRKGVRQRPLMLKCSRRNLEATGWTQSVMCGGKS